MIKKTLAFIVGIAVACAIISFGEQYIFKKFPQLETFSRLSWSLAKQKVDAVPDEAWYYLIVEWIIACLVCGILIKVISKSSKMGMPIVCGVFLMAAAAAKFFERPHPTWVIVASFLVFVPITFAGFKFFPAKTMSLEEEDLEDDKDLS